MGDILLIVPHDSKERATTIQNHFRSLSIAKRAATGFSEILVVSTTGLGEILGKIRQLRGLLTILFLPNASGFQAEVVAQLDKPRTRVVLIVEDERLVGKGMLRDILVLSTRQIDASDSIFDFIRRPEQSS